ncbi:dCTP deaminase [Mucilaginibacter sp. SG538B]|uniref:dCTP deaminase n=1 Tax=Mucilaginibacter sp. SG538B TaxID=2587021 RepID=UPI00159DD192|nr:dCTP deaminase [Mucilaginibacter sp. SG538B]NVM64187.1 dCTP deaminase [Mucilaginibacter sp. SG538B]NVM64226.1 dCTP deaminase [Mucilaginibacter sp. SG538B]
MSGFASKKKIKELLGTQKMVIRPLLDEAQISHIGVDFRLGCNFLVSVHGREAFINTSLNEETGTGQRDVRLFFQESRRQIGETFILYPHQTVLASSLEYVKMPKDHLLTLYMRSSYSRLGLTVSTIVQPGYCGCLSIELTNNNNNPIKLVVGARVFQGVLVPSDEESDYFSNPRKYVCSVRPEPSAAISDEDIKTLSELWRLKNNR